MLKQMRESKLFYWSVQILVIALLIWVFSQIGWVFTPIATFFSTLFGPIIAAGFLFYMLNPLVKLMMKIHIPRRIAVWLIFLILLGAVALLVAAIIPNLISQVTQIVNNFPEFIAEVRKSTTAFLNKPSLRKYNLSQSLTQLKIDPATILRSLLGGVSDNIGGVVSSVGSAVISAITVPVMLYYFLKDGHKLIPNIQRFFPNRFNDQIGDVLTKMNETISHYVAGEAVELLFVGTATGIGYVIIGMPYALLLGVVAGFMNIIPYLGPYIGVAPALIIAATISWEQMALVAVVVVIVQQLDGNFIYPNVVGKALDIHPLTIIILLLVVGNLWGIIGMIVGVPVYAVVKTVVEYWRNIRVLRENGDLEEFKEVPVQWHLPHPKDKQ
ncbi:AI-2E family transporter [Schleiferilactobacillus perolens]|jgi:predicted PurR-regulated permease PerM|uniref:Permease n=1 Tax=Schleiferilactobacillus perolens DSM 12744 TaxID=1423792 RepID=A0A0R1N500_9LACO|nr:AI-2E family transporter [Schleiferilactobacillus perolens]KRL13380.1 permease [Schleiferilactobacillus perolens DSM 12744]MCI1892468.1 AI-2E family transporter [Schleiferilactobacillus harbinensis]MCI1911599.1 AI-2E family transporter [Schleiferilactobacillus harbinensis]MCI2170296.1 AI-2E family transporter [Schleiferilactobacillus perolens]